MYIMLNSKSAWTLSFL